MSPPARKYVPEDLTPVELIALAAGLKSTPPDPRVSKAVRFAVDAVDVSDAVDRESRGVCPHGTPLLQRCLACNP